MIEPAGFMPSDRDNDEEREARLDRLLEDSQAKTAAVAERVDKVVDSVKKISKMAKANREAAGHQPQRQR